MESKAFIVKSKDIASGMSCVSVDSIVDLIFSTTCLKIVVTNINHPCTWHFVCPLELSDECDNIELLQMEFGPVTQIHVKLLKMFLQNMSDVSDDLWVYANDDEISKISTIGTKSSSLQCSAELCFTGHPCDAKCQPPEMSGIVSSTCKFTNHDISWCLEYASQYAVVRLGVSNNSIILLEFNDLSGGHFSFYIPAHV